jgi:NDP-sugar pyrophosphorylase family protein
VEAMVFAAGLGTRLRPLTDRMPKALVEVDGVPMLERVARRLVAAGVTRIVVNVCPFADDIERFVRERKGFGVEVVISREAPSPLETGGGLLHARSHFREDGPIVLHNVDVMSDLSIAGLVEAHARSEALATLAVADRPSSRRLVFDDRGLLGRDDASRGAAIRVRAPIGTPLAIAFAGVHVVSPRILDLVTERGAFSILDPYLRLARAGHVLAPYRVDGCRWVDVGRPETLEEARQASLP